MTFRELVEGRGLWGSHGLPELREDLAAWEAASAGGCVPGEGRWRWQVALTGDGTREAFAEAAGRGRVVVLGDDPGVRCRVVLFRDHAVNVDLKGEGAVTWVSWLAPAPARGVGEGTAVGPFLEAIGETHFSRAGNPDEALTSNAGRETLMEAVADVAAWVGVAPEGMDGLWLGGAVVEEGWKASFGFEGGIDAGKVEGLAEAVMRALVGTLEPRGRQYVQVGTWDNLASAWDRRPAWESFPMDRSPGSATLRRAALAGMRDRRAAAAARLAARIEAWDPGLADELRRSVP